MGVATGQGPLLTTFRAVVPGRAAATATSEVAVARPTVAGVVSAVRYAPSTDIVGADTNSLTLSLINKGTDGNGTTVVATLALAAAAGTKVDFVPFTLTLSGTAANLDVAANAVLAWKSEKVGTGLTDPGGLVEVDFTRD